MLTLAARLLIRFTKTTLPRLCWLLRNPSDDGGTDELRGFCPNRAFSCSTNPVSCSTRAVSSASMRAPCSAICVRAASSSTAWRSTT
jgi:hypothetical protein